MRIDSNFYSFPRSTFSLHIDKYKRGKQRDVSSMVDRNSKESFELVGGSFLRTKLAGSGGTKPTFEAAKTIHPKSKQSRGNPKPIPKELHSKTIHVLAPSQTTARIRSRCRFHWMPKLVEEFVAKVDILLSQEPRKANPEGFHSFLIFFFFLFPFSNLLTSMLLIPWTFSCWCVGPFSSLIFISLNVPDRVH